MRVSLSKIEELARPVVERHGCELVDVQLASEPGRGILRILLDKDGGIMVGDCEHVSRELNTLLDVEGGIYGPYSLEVSSPGPKRPLKKREDFEKFVGEKVEIETAEPIDGRRHYKGLFKGFEEGSVVVEVDGVSFKISFENVKKACLTK